MKKINMELNESKKAQGYTMRANVNADCIRAFKRWNKEDGKAVAEAIKSGDVKKAIYHMSNAKSRNRQIREISAHHDKLIFLNGKTGGYLKPIQENAMNGRNDNHTTHPAGLRREKEEKYGMENKRK